MLRTPPPHRANPTPFRRDQPTPVNVPDKRPDSSNVSGLSIHSNLHGHRAQRAYASYTRQLNSTLERLATGKQINRAADDPSGLQAVSQMKARLADLNKRIESLEQSDA